MTVPKLLIPECDQRDGRQRQTGSPANEGSLSYTRASSGSCSNEKSVVWESDYYFRDVITNSIEEILQRRPQEPLQLLVDNLLKSSPTHEIERHDLIAGDGTNYVLSKACKRKNGADSLHVGGLPLLRLITPSAFEVDAAIRCLSELTVPPARLIVFIEHPAPYVDLCFVKGTPYFANLTEQLMKRRREGDPDKVLDSAVGTDEIVTHIGENLKLPTKTVRETMDSVAALTPRCSVAELPRLQSNFFDTFHVLDAALHSRRHDQLLPSPTTSVPGILLVSYNTIAAPMTFTRVIATLLPLYQEVQRLKVAETLRSNKERIGQLNFHYVMEYWKGVLQRRDCRDKARGESHAVNQRAPRKKVPQHGTKVTTLTPRSVPAHEVRRVQRRENEDAAFLRVIQQLQSNAVVRIQALYRGYRWRKRMGWALTERLKARPPTSAAACWVDDLPLSTPPLLRQCVEHLSATHGEVFGNYVISCPPVPRTVTILKPTSHVIKASKKETSDDIDSEEEIWEEERIAVPVSRQTKLPPHFNVLRRLMECEYAGKCNTLRYATSIQQDCTGLSTLQHRAYDSYKSLVLNLLHIAYLELYYRGRIPLTVRNFEAYVNRWHLDVFSWFSVPHIFSRITLRRTMQLPHPIPIISTKEAVEKERVLIARAYGRGAVHNCPGSETNAVVGRAESSVEEKEEDRGSDLVGTRQYLMMSVSFTNDGCYVPGVYAVPVLLSQRWWEVALKDVISGNRESKVAWWTLYDSPAVYIGGQPVSLAPRHELQEVEGRPRFDELTPCVEVVRRARTQSMSSRDYSNAGSVSPVRCRRYTLNGTTCDTSPHRLVGGSGGSERTAIEGSTNGTGTTSTAGSGGNIVSTFGVSLASEDFYLARELRRNFLDELAAKFPQYCTVGPLTQYGIPAPVHGLQALVIAPDMVDGPLNDYNCLDVDTYITSSTGVDSACYFSLDQALSTEGEKLEHQHSVTLEWGDLSCMSLRKPSGDRLDPLRFVKRPQMSEHVSNIPNIDTVNAMATYVGQRIMPEGSFVHERPWLTPVCCRSRAHSFSDFMIQCLHQIRDGYKIVVAVEEPYQIMLFGAVCLLKLAAKEEDMVQPLMSSTCPSEDVPDPSAVQSELFSSDTSECLSFLTTFYDELRKSVDTTIVSVEECVVTVQKVMQRMLPGGLLFLDHIPMLMREAERESNRRLLRESIVAIVQRIELYCWLVTFQVFLISAVRSHSNGMKLDEILGKFHTYVNAPHILQWLDRIDPWKNAPQRSPDPFHLRYSNGLRRWEKQHFIFRGASVM